MPLLLIDHDRSGIDFDQSENLNVNFRSILGEKIKIYYAYYLKKREISRDHKNFSGVNYRYCVLIISVKQHATQIVKGCVWSTGNW